MWTKLAIKSDTKEMLLNECVKEFLRHNPAFEGMNITQDFILMKVITFYLSN